MNEPYKPGMEQLFGVSVPEARVWLDLCRQGVPVDPVLITVCLVLTGDLELQNLINSYDQCLTLFPSYA